jgi:4-hydroxybenzoate polyprenyltransferase
MVLARTWAMLVNRLADADFDAANPRTARRAVASGRLPRRSAALIAVLCAAAFTAAAAAFWLFFANFWPLALALPVLAWLALYSFAKRFTALCHLLLGTALAISPLAAALAIRPAALTDTPALYWLAAMVTTWVAGFDTIYALQDTDFDQQRKLFSIPSRLGVPAALWISRLLHLTAAAALFMAALADPRLNGPPFLLAVVLATLLLIAEHAVLARRGKAGLDMAFFTLNGIVSCVVGGLGVVALLIA